MRLEALDKTALRRGTPSTWIRLSRGFVAGSALSTAAVYKGSRELDRYTPCIGSESERFKSPSPAPPHSAHPVASGQLVLVPEKAAAAFQEL
jgi:hypothetical protein